MLNNKRPVDRSEVYLESRRRKTGEFHPKVADDMVSFVISVVIIKFLQVSSFNGFNQFINNFAAKIE